MTPTRVITKFFLAILFSISLASTALAQQATAPIAAGRVVEVKVPAPSLKGNLLGDPRNKVSLSTSLRVTTLHQRDGSQNNKIRKRLETRLFRFFTETLDFPPTPAP
jgi:hypothetical protein